MANEKAQDLCWQSPEGLRDLVQQNARFRKQMEEQKAMKSRKNHSKKHFNEKKLAAQFNSQTPKEKKTMQFNAKEEVPIKGSADGTRFENRDLFSEANGQHPKKGKSKGKAGESEKSRGPNGLKTDMMDPQKDKSCALQMDLSTLQELVKSLVRQAYAALTDRRCHSAQGAFSELLEILEPFDLKKLHLTTIDYVVLLYGHASALLGIGHCEELTEAENQLKRIIHQYSKEKFNCLVFYGIGNVYFRQNRFSDALNQYVKSHTMVKHKIVPGVLTWPTTSVVLEETRTEKLQLLLENCIEECKFPPKPAAVCRYDQCLSLPKTQIYFTDPGFKGFIRMMCCQFCKVEFHVCCWKKLKASIYFDKNDKDFLKTSCLTPDCKGRISNIAIRDSTGLVKCEFEDKTIKKREPQRAIVKQKNTSNNNFKMKPESKTRKKTEQEESICSATDEKEEKPRESSPSKQMDINVNFYWISDNDPLLAEMLDNEDMMKFGIPDTNEFCDLLVSWRIISQEELDAFSFATSCCLSSAEMHLLLYHLYELNNKVKTRIFLYLLTRCGYSLTFELLGWLLFIDDLGLEAAKNFCLRYAGLLKRLHFGPLVNQWNETYGKNLNFLISDCPAEEMVEIFNRVTPETFRCFIWFLEDNKKSFSSAELDDALDVYFSKMDNEDIEFPNEERPTNCIKVKNKHKKKKQNRPKPVLKLSGAVSTRSQEEDIFTEENTLSLLDPTDPFLTPGYLRDQVEEFEALYEAVPAGNRFQEKLDHNADNIRETLFEYFYQILEEHGPVEMDDWILVREYMDFPEETHRLVAEAGGLPAFLLQSPRFGMVGNLIGLMKHAVLLEGCSEKPMLNPTAREFKPSSNKPFSAQIGHDGVISSDIGTVQMPYTFIPLSNQAPIFENPLINNYVQSIQPGYFIDDRTWPIRPIMPLGPFVPIPSIGLQPPLTVAGGGMDMMGVGEGAECESCVVDRPDTPQHAYHISQPDGPHGKSLGHVNWGIGTEATKSPTIQMKKNIHTAIVAVQVDIDLSENEVNTDPFHPFETQQGDMLRMEKEHLVLQNQLEEATEKYEHLQCHCQEEIADLYKEIRETVETNKISKKELDWLNQDSDNEAKKWQQEKKENQDRIKAIRNNIKMVTEAKEKYSRDIEEKQKQYKAYLQDFLQICFSKFEKAKAKVEKRTKKGQDDLQEAIKRAVAAEVNVLENRWQAELLKRRNVASKAELSVNVLKTMAVSGSASAQTLKQVSAWESLLLTFNLETEKLKSQFEERIKLVKDGTALSSLAEIQVPSLQPPPNVSALQNQPFAPNFMPLSSAPLHPNPSSLLAKPPSLAPVQSPLKKTIGSEAAIYKEADKAHAPPVSINVPKLPVPVTSKVHWEIGQERRENLQPDVKQVLSPGKQVLSPGKQVLSPGKQTLFDQIIEQLQVIFPHYKSRELANFIKDVRSASGGTLAGMGHDEIVSRVIEHILDHQAKSAVATSQGVQGPKPAAGKAPKPVLANLQSFSKPAMASSPIPPPPKQPWRVVRGASKKWQKSTASESFSDEPCMICLDDVSQQSFQMLDCGHRFHEHCIKKWLNTKSTCPTCREHALLPEDFPALCGRMRNA